MGKKKVTSKSEEAAIIAKRKAFEKFDEELKACGDDIFKWISTCGQPIKNRIDYTNHPALSFEELMSMYATHTVLCLDDVLSSLKTWRVVYQQLIDIMKYGFEDDDVRRTLIYFTIHKGESEIYRLQITHFISNMILWYAFVVNDAVDIMDETYIFDFVSKNQNDINEYINEKILKTMGWGQTQSAIIDEIAFNITAISKAFLPVIGQGVSSIDIIEAAEVFPEIDEIIHTKIPDGLQPREIEEFLSKQTDRLIELFCQYESCFRPLFRGGKNLTKDQFKEIAVAIGLKSNLNGKVLPYIVNHNIMVDGICDPASQMTIALSARKSAILSKIFMSDPGAFSKKAIANTAGIRLRKDYEDCDTEVFVDYDIVDEKTLLLLNNRFYYDENGELQCVDASRDKHLIGKTLPFRSPATCTSKEGICYHCYGKLFDLNNQLVSVGAYAALIETEYIGQTVLGTKHSQTTDSTLISFNEEFDNDFELNCTEVYLKENGDSTDDLFMVFDEIFKEESEDNKPLYYVYGFGVIDSDQKVLYRVVEENGIKIYLSKELTATFKSSITKSAAIIPFSEIDENSPLFNVEMTSKESTEPTKRMKAMLDKNEHAGCTTINELCNHMGQCKIQGGAMYDFVHHEVIIRSMLRKKSNIYEFPDFGPGGDHDDYQIITLGKSLRENPSPLISLRYGYLRKLLMSPELYDGVSKTSVSDIDPLFAKNLMDIT